MFPGPPFPPVATRHAIDITFCNDFVMIASHTEEYPLLSEENLSKRDYKEGVPKLLVRTEMQAKGGSDDGFEPQPQLFCL